jgi:peptidoglycan/LPS O-acetylase OafA/YrhL
MVYGLAGAELRGKLRTPQPFVELGAASYSIYLIHVIVLLFVRQALLIVRPHLAMPAEVWFLIGVTASTCAGLMFSRYVERPMLQRLGRWRRPLTPAQSVS